MQAQKGFEGANLFGTMVKVMKTDGIKGFYRLDIIVCMIAIQMIYRVLYIVKRSCASMMGIWYLSIDSVLSL